MTLEDIGREHGTDKATHHRYLPLYELLFRPFFGKPQVKILEVGIQFGNSLRTWADYFLEPIIVGIDCVDNDVKPIPYTAMLFGNAYSEDMLKRLSPSTKFQIIIDDGSHRPEDQEWFLQHYHQLLTQDGILIIEDVLSFDNAVELTMARPVGFQHTIVEMTEGNSVVDSRLFIMWR